jgi:hypothetical protein
MSEQAANFDELESKLNALAAATDDAERAQLQREIEVLLSTQQKLTERTHEELGNFVREMEQLRAGTLESNGIAGGADVWLTVGQGINVGERDNVFIMQAVDGSRRVRVNMGGEVKLLNPGDFVEAPTRDGVRKVYYKQTSRGEDRTQVGFGVVRPGA